MIPRIIHQTWKDSNPPPRVYPSEWIESWRTHNPRWEYRLWTDDDLERLVAEDSPDALDTFRRVPGIMKADFGRYLVLWRHGGLYADLDYECLRPFDEFRVRNILLSWDDDEPQEGLEPWINNALLGTAPKHPLFRLAATECLRRMQTMDWGCDGAFGGSTLSQKIHKITGPGMLTECFDRMGIAPEVVLPAAVLCPLSWRRQEWLSYQGITYDDIPRLREQFRAAGAFAVTYWTGFWDKGRKARIF